MGILIALAVLALIVGIAYLQHRATRGIYTPLASRQPPRAEKAEKPLGMEATDLDMVLRTARRNEGLERSNSGITRSGWTGLGAVSAEATIEPMPDDETYARRFHAAYMKNKTKDT